MRWPWQRKNLSIDTVLENIRLLSTAASGEHVTPDNCMRSPTMQAIVQAVSRRISVAPMQVFAVSQASGRLNKTWLVDHPVANLMRMPNQYQSEQEYWLDMVSTLLRWGNFFAEKANGAISGQTRALTPIDPSNVQVDERELAEGRVVWRITEMQGSQREVPDEEMHRVRMNARNYLIGDSPVNDVREAIAMEIAAERMGAEVFGNTALPFLAFEYHDMSQAMPEEARMQFLEATDRAYGKGTRNRSMLVPKGMKLNTVDVDNERAQFLETRKYQRTVIAGAFGVPPHLVGDLERGTFNNVEQQDKDFVINVVLPITRMIESAMERDLLTDQERRDGLQIRFNLDEVQRADFKSRQEGLFRQRQAGVISANDWREREGLNPREDEGGEEYWQPVNMADDGPTNDQSMQESTDEPRLREVTTGN